MIKPPYAKTSSKLSFELSGTIPSLKWTQPLWINSHLGFRFG
ncbi:unnamed protein product [Arabidopsis halleri]